MQHLWAESVYDAGDAGVAEFVRIRITSRVVRSLTTSATVVGQRKIAILSVPKTPNFAEILTMSIDKSLRRKSGIARNRSVLTRDERIKVLMETERWTEGRSPYNLPKVRVAKIVVKKAPKKEKAAEGEAGAAPAAEAGKAPAAGAKAPAAAAAKPAAKPDAKGGKK